MSLDNKNIIDLDLKKNQNDWESVIFVSASSLFKTEK
jgi:hypothetical protein